MLEFIPIPWPRWRWFFVIRNGDLFWIHRRQWSRDMQHRLEYYRNGVGWYSRRCEASILPLELRSHNPVSGPDNPVAMTALVEEFLAKYGGLGLLEAKPAGGQGGLTVLCVIGSGELPLEAIPLYFRGVRVSVELVPDVGLEQIPRDTA